MPRLVLKALLVAAYGFGCWLVVAWYLTWYFTARLLLLVVMVRLASVAVHRLRTSSSATRRFVASDRRQLDEPAEDASRLTVVGIYAALTVIPAVGAIHGVGYGFANRPEVVAMIDVIAVPALLATIWLIRRDRRRQAQQLTPLGGEL